MARDYAPLREGAARLARAVREQQPLWVWGDFDTDGQTATALLVGGLRALGATADYHIPDRRLDGHGLHPRGLEELAAGGCRLLVTCDCGTTDVAQVAFAGALGIEVIVTDHHAQVGPPPPALAVINPAHLPADHPFAGLPGVGVAYLLLRAVRALLGRQEPVRALDLVALGIVADVAPHSPANRTLLARGLPRLWGSPRQGLAALIALSGLHPDPLDTAAISFTLAPILNAAGRLDDARLGVELLLARDPEAATAQARALLALNAERKGLERALEALAEASIAPDQRAAPALVLEGQGWHPGLIGLVATKLAQRHGRTTLLIALPADGEPARGSGRAYGGASLLALLAGQADLLLGYGGHDGAAGFTIRPDRIAAFRAAVQATLAAAPGEAEPGPTLAVDAVIPWPSIETRDAGPGSLYGALQRLAPFGHGNPQPVLASLGLRVVGSRALGAEGRHLRLSLADSAGCCREVTCWGLDAAWLPEGPLDVAYRLQRDDWQGRTRVQLVLEGVRAHQPGV